MDNKFTTLKATMETSLMLEQLANLRNLTKLDCLAEIVKRDYSETFFAREVALDLSEIVEKEVIRK